jgi:hypothetical protein
MRWLEAQSEAFFAPVVANDNVMARPKWRGRFLVSGLVSFLLGVFVAITMTGHPVCEHPRARDDRGTRGRLAELVPPPALGPQLLSLSPPVHLE